MTKTRSIPGRGLIAGAVVAAGGLAAGTAYLRHRRALKPQSAEESGEPGKLAAGAAYVRDRTRGAARTPARENKEPATWSCECGQEFRVSGRDRHRLYWLPDAEPDDPVLDDHCPACERQLSTQAS